VRFSLKDPVDPMYSNLQRVLDEYKGDKIATSGLIQYLSGRGVKAEEIKWSGIEQYIVGKKSVSKAELAEFLTGNSLEIEDIKVGEVGEDVVSLDYSEDRINVYSGKGEVASVRQLGDGTWYDAVNDKEFDTYEAALEYARDVAESEREHWREESGGPRYEKYALPGGKNYREVLFTLPRVEGEYRSEHWNERNVVAHTRLQDFETADPGAFYRGGSKRLALRGAGGWVYA